MSWVINSSWCRVVLLYSATPHPSHSGVTRVWQFNGDILTLVTNWRQSWLSCLTVLAEPNWTIRDPTDWLKRSAFGTWLTTNSQQVLWEGVLRDPFSQVSTVSSHPLLRTVMGQSWAVSPHPLSSLSWPGSAAGWWVSGRISWSRGRRSWGAPTLTRCWKCSSLLSVSNVVIHRQEESGTVSRVSLEWSTSRIGPSLPHFEQRILKFHMYSFDQDYPTKRSDWRHSYIAHKNHQNPEVDISKTLSLVWRKTLKRSSRARVKLISLMPFCCLSQQHSTIMELQE